MIRDVSPHTSSNYPCNWAGDTTVKITNRSSVAASYNIRFARDQHQNKSGSVAPGATTEVRIGCGGIGTPGLDFHNESGAPLTVESR